MRRRITCYNASQTAIICYNLIHMDPLETAEMLAFTKTVEAKSLSRAAIEIGVPRATLGRRLARLESRLKVRLLRRTTRSLALTDAGEAFYAHARIALDAIEQAERSVQTHNAAIAGTLRVSLPPITDPAFYAMLSEFSARYPDVRVQVQFSSRYVDLHRDGFDVALRASMALEPGLIARPLARAPLVAVASPAYLTECGTPKSPRDLRHHRLLLGFARGEVPQTHWPLASGKRIRVDGVIVSNEIAFLCEAAVRGRGIALLPRMIVDSHLANGTLVPVLERSVGAESSISLVYPEREFVPPQVRAFVDTVAAWAKHGFAFPVSAAKQRSLRSGA